VFDAGWCFDRAQQFVIMPFETRDCCVIDKKYWWHNMEMTHTTQ
jgi:hypothetical protein